MTPLSAMGATALGVVIGWFVRGLSRKVEKITPEAIGALVAVLVGGVAIEFLEVDKSVWWLYPIGLLLGFLIEQQLANNGKGFARTSGVAASGKPWF